MVLKCLSLRTSPILWAFSLWSALSPSPKITFLHKGFLQPLLWWKPSVPFLPSKTLWKKRIMNAGIWAHLTLSCRSASSSSSSTHQSPSVQVAAVFSPCFCLNTLFSVPLCYDPHTHFHDHLLNSAKRSCPSALLLLFWMHWKAVWCWEWSFIGGLYLSLSTQ